MKTTHLLQVAVLSLAAMTAHAATGTLRFSGRVVDAACSPRINGVQQLHLDACPIAADGLRVFANTPVKARASGKTGVKTLRLSNRVQGTDERTFSDQYPLQAPSSGSYVVIIDYP